VRLNELAHDVDVDETLGQNCRRRASPSTSSRAGQRLERGNVARAGHDHVRLAASVVRGPLLDSDARLAVLDRRVHVEPLRFELSSSRDHVRAVPAAQAVTRN